MAELDNVDTTDSPVFEIVIGHDGAVVMSVAGDIDVATADSFKRTVESAIATAPAGIVFDMSGVDFMDSSGIAVLIHAAQRVDAVEIRRPSRVVRMVIEATGLSDVLRMIE